MTRPARLRRGRQRSTALVAAMLLASCGEPSTSGPASPAPGSLTSLATMPADSAADRSPAVDNPESQPSSQRPARIEALNPETGQLNTEWTWPALAWVSDGEYVVYSSSVADGSAASGAADLWRYRPGATEPELVFSNPQRDRDLLPIAGAGGRYAFVDYSATGERSWNLWLIPAVGEPPIMLDTHPGDAEVSSLVPSFELDPERIVWSAFDRGPSGPVHELWIAESPAWEPQRLRSVDAERQELWFPSVHGDSLAFVELTYIENRNRDERHAMVMDLSNPEAAPRRLDQRGRASATIALPDGVMWKETEPGMSQFNWGVLLRHRFADGLTTRMSTAPQSFVTAPSAGARFVAADGADGAVFTVHDLETSLSRRVFSDAPTATVVPVSPHISGDLLVFSVAQIDERTAGGVPRLSWALLPAPGEEG